MTAKTHIAAAAHPDVNFRVKMKPFEFEIGGQGSFAVTTGEIHARFDEIPISVTIPFLPRRVIAGSVGPFGVQIKPFEAQVRDVALDVRGRLGRENVEADVHAKGDCKAEIEISGALADKAVKAVIKTIVEE
jgi:hypothetical protein